MIPGLGLSLARRTDFSSKRCGVGRRCGQGERTFIRLSALNARVTKLSNILDSRRRLRAVFLLSGGHKARAVTAECRVDKLAG